MMRPEDRGWSRALDIQMDYHKWCSSSQGKVYNYTFFLDVLERVTSDIPDAQPTLGTSAAQLAHDVIEALWQADTLFVTSDMLHVLQQAAHDLPEDAPVDEHVLITPNGFCLFEEPLIGTDRKGQTVCIHGILWKKILGHKSSDPSTLEQMLILYFLVDPADETDDWNEGFLPMMEELGLGHPPITLQHFYPARFGSTVRSLESPSGDEAGITIIRDTLRLFLAMQLLAQQRMGEPMRMNPDRATRKRAAKWHEGDRYITLITLRRKSVKNDDLEPQKVEWSHRWLVKGHWRKQYYPKTKTHDYVYIFGYVKGPEDKPLVVRERRVFNFRR